MSDPTPEGVLQHVALIRTDVIRPFRAQPRQEAERKAIQELADSIDAVGQLMPGLVRPLKGTPRYKWELIDGERRFHACRRLGIPFKAIPTYVRNEQHQFEMSVAANFGRADHTPLEIAYAAKTLRGGGRTLEQVAKIFGKSSGWVADYLKLTELTPAVQELLVPDEATGKPRLKLTYARRIAELPARLQMKAAERAMQPDAGVFAVAEHVRKIQKMHGLARTERAPNRDWLVVLRLFTRLKRDLAPLLDWGEPALRSLLANRTERDLEACQDLPEAVAGDLAMFAETLSKLIREELKCRRRRAAG